MKKIKILLLQISIVLLSFSPSYSSAALTGAISIIPSATEGAAGDAITFTVKLDALVDDLILINGAGVILQWDINAFAFDASSALGSTGDNDPHGTSYLDGLFGYELNDDNNKLMVESSGDSDLFQLRYSDLDGLGDPLYGLSGFAYLNNTRTTSYHQNGSPISDYTLFDVTLNVKEGAVLGYSNIISKVIAVADYKTGSTPDDYSQGVASINITASPAPVPIPGAVWLFGSGIVGILGCRLKKNS